MDTASAGAARIFVVEDEFLLATLLEEDLQSAGYTIAGPFTQLGEAMQAAEQESFDLALLDVNLRGEHVYPLADRLLARHIPVILLSGYGPGLLPERFRGTPCIAKPYRYDPLIATIRSTLHSATPRTQQTT